MTLPPLPAVRLTHPDLLWLAAVPATLAVLGLITRHRRRAAIATLGLPANRTGPRRPGVFSALVLVAAWSLAVVGAAGPRWGDGEDDGVAVGRDVVVALDLSRSMLADDTATGQARWQHAVAAAADLVESLRLRGGHRVGVVVFAARPVLLVPLTTDYDHVAAKLAELDAAHPPPAVRPGDDPPASGTRTGAALAAAVAAHDERFPGSQDIILVSDGDDPADDREWAKGVSAARAANVPVHVVGVGDPAQASPVFVGGQPLETEGANGVRDWVRTRLREDVLREIATEARGAYLPARRDVPALGDFFRTTVEPRPSRELTDDALPRPKDRSDGFLAAAVVLFVLGWWRRG